MKIFLLFIIILVTLITLKIRRKTGLYLILFSILLVSALNIYLNIHMGTSVLYVHSLIFLLIFYVIFLLFQKKTQNQNEVSYSKGLVNIIIINIFVIIMLFLIQLAMIEDLYNEQLFVRNMMTYVFILLLILLFLTLSKYIVLKEKVVFKSISYFSLLNSLLGIMQYITNKKLLLFQESGNIEYYEGIVVVKRAVGFIGANNGAGNLGAILFPFLLYQLVKKKSPINLLILLLDIIFTLLTLTRAGIFSIGVVLIIYFLLLKINTLKALIKKFIYTFLIIISMLLFRIFLFDTFYRILFEERGATESYRTFQFEYAIKMFKENPIIGIGSGNFDNFAFIHFGIPQMGILHSQWLNIIVEQGIISFFLYILFNILLFIILIRKYKDTVWFPIALFIGYFIPININANQYYELNNIIFYFIIFGLIFSERPESISEEKQLVERISTIIK